MTRRALGVKAPISVMISIRPNCSDLL